MKHVLAALLAACAVAIPAAAHAQGAKPELGPGTALLIVDIQNFYFDAGTVPLSGSVAAARHARRVLDVFRARKLPIIHIRHAGRNTVFVDGEPSDPQYRIHPEVAPAAGEKVITKHYANSFRETELLQYLREQKITSLVIVGMQTHMCVEAAARAATDLGFGVTVVPEACATRALTYAAQTVPAEMVHAAALAALNGTYGRVMPIEAWLEAAASRPR